MTAPNIPALSDLLGFLGEHPELHRQDVWVEENTDCGTVACAAGWAVLRAGYTCSREFRVFDASGKDHGTIQRAAANLLGLKPQQARTFFHSAIAYTEQKQMVDRLARNPDDLCDDLLDAAEARASQAE